MVQVEFEPSSRARCSHLLKDPISSFDEFNPLCGVDNHDEVVLQARPMISTIGPTVCAKCQYFYRQSTEGYLKVGDCLVTDH